MSPANPEERNQFVWYSKQWLLVPYVWSGNDFSGVDCSQLVVECFKSIGHYDHTEDYSANSLFNKYKHNIIQKSAVKSGCLAFWFNNEGTAKHVAIFINKFQIIHATGGGRSTNSIADAIIKNAFVKVSGFEKIAEYRKKHYSQTYKIVDPFKNSEDNNV